MAAVAGVQGCGLLDPEPFVDFEQFEAIPRIAQLDFSSSTVEPGVVYWELREARDFDDGYRVRTSGGSITREEISPDYLAAFDTVSSFSGYSPSCLPGDCFHYIATLADDGAAGVRGSLPTVQTLFAPVDALGEAALIVQAAGYSWSSPLETGAFRREGDAWRLVVTRLVSACDPIRVDRFLLEVGRDGNVAVLKQELYSEERDVCI